MHASIWHTATVVAAVASRLRQSFQMTTDRIQGHTGSGDERRNGDTYT